MGRSPCCSKEAHLNRGAWTAMEDKMLTDYIKIHGEGRWRNLPQKAGLKRCGKSCRLRWLNYLRPDIKRGNISPDEEELIIRLHKLLGNRWSLIAGRLPGRTDNEIKNYWNTTLGKRVQNSHSKNKAIISHVSTKPKNPSPAVASPGHVVRTRAVKCTKVNLNEKSHVSGKDQAAPRVPATAFSEGDFDISGGENPGLGFGHDQGNIDVTRNTDLVLNFDVDELFLTDLLMNSEFPHVDYFGDMNYINTSRNDDDYRDILFSVPDWTTSNGSNNNVGIRKEQNVVPDYYSSFTPFLGT